MRRWRLATLAGVVLLLGCSGPSDARPSASTSPAAQSPAAQSPAAQSPAAESPAAQSPAAHDALADWEPFEQAQVVLSGDGGEVRVPVYVADSPELRRQGLMGREELAADAGMAFLWPSEHQATFRMKDTLIPLSIAFVAADGEVVEIIDMQPCRADPCPTHGPDVAYQHALEVNQGAFARWGVEPGWHAQMPWPPGASP